MNHNHSSSSCNCAFSHSSQPYQQSLDELDFNRSLHQAVVNNEIERVRKMLSVEGGKSIVNQEDKAGFSPLLYVSRTGNVEIAKLLLNAGACPDGQTRIGNTSCLIRCCLFGHYKLALLFLKAGANPNIIDQDGRSARTVLENVPGAQLEREELLRLLPASAS